MTDYILNTEAEVADFISDLEARAYFISKHKFVNNQCLIDLSDGDRIILPKELGKHWPAIQATQPKYDSLIYGKSDIEKIVSIEADGNILTIYKETSPGVIETEIRETTHWIIGTRKPGKGKYTELEGNLPYKYLQEYTEPKNYYAARNSCYAKKIDFYTIADARESAMARDGYTYFKGMKLEDLSVLSFDIETSGLKPEADDACVYLISNTYRAANRVVKRLFALDDFETEADMIEAWVEWVRLVDPSVVIGHNIYSFDLPYLDYRLRVSSGSGLNLGRNGDAIKFNTRASKIRKDGSQSYEYFKVFIHGREIIDTWFLSLKYDIGRNFPSYGLKPIIEYLGYEKEGRIKWDFGANNPKKIFQEMSSNPDVFSESHHLWDQFKEYCEDDADDSLKLFDLMIPSFFYWTQHIPKPFQTINESATGSQINVFLVRGYLQDGHSLPKASEKAPFEGATTFGNPGIYHNVRKIDVASLYPSIILEYKIRDPRKDPKDYITKMVEYFVTERLRNKKLANETGDPHYRDLEQSQKIGINSIYGFLGAQGLLFNNPENAALVTRKGREILAQAMEWARDRDYVMPNGDTDSISYAKSDNTPISDEQFEIDLDDINSMCGEKIIWEDDGSYESFVVIKAKNYILRNEGKIKYKGSGLTSSKTEKGLREMIERVGVELLDENYPEINEIYKQYIIEANNVEDMSRWVSKKTITEAVLNPERTQEQKLFDAIQGTEYSEGDKILTFFKEDDTMGLLADWSNNESKAKLTGRVRKTLEIFKTVLNMDDFEKYHLKTKRPQLCELLGIEYVKPTRKKK